MASRVLKRQGLEGAAKIFIAIGLLLMLSSWVAAVYYFGPVGNITLFIIPFIFSCVLAVLLLVIRYRYTIFERYPYLMNLPSIFYRIGEKNGTNDKSIAFSMIFTVHSFVIAVIGFLSLILTISIGSSIKSSAASPLLYVYVATIVVLGIAVLLQYRRIYIRFVK